MAKRSYVSELKDGESVLLKGWVFEIRDLAKLKFVLLRDFTGIVQCVVKDDKIMKKIAELESVVEIKGKVKKGAVRAEFARDDVEVEVSEIKILSESGKLPIQVNEKAVSAELPNRLDWRCLDLRKPKSLAIFKVQAALIEGMQEWLNQDGYLQVFTPCLMGVPSESGSEVFEVKYFKGKAFLRQDPQLHRQLAIAGGLEKVYDIGPSWRAEKSHTVNHLTEHRTCAVEFAFIEDERDTMRVEEQVVISAFKKVNEKCSNELKKLGVKLKIPKAPFPEINFPEVYDILREMGKDVQNGDDLDREDEKLLWKYVQKKYPGIEFYFLNKFPFKLKPFYVGSDDDNSGAAKSVDLYYCGLELSSGGQRENNYEKLMRNVKDKKMDPKSVEWFTKFFKYGVPTHGGFALGIERITKVLLDIPNIRETALFPRDVNRTTP
jgi:nondiscriminating aspartyl-tRNA synthetase